MTLKQLRYNAGYSQSKLARMMEVQERTVERWEQGRVVPTARNMERLAEVLEVGRWEVVRAIWGERETA